MFASSSTYVTWTAMWEIVAIGLGAGAGLTAVFSVGLVALSITRRDGGVGGVRSIVGWTLAVLCFLVVLGGIAYGISVMFTK
ncbi:MAG TPA: hypothetical protein VHB02_11665 [Acidimicrobiales bacterium]|nr:hypothetical protein [Acidimicrobiales bacterium]